MAFGRHLSHTLASLAKKIRCGLVLRIHGNWEVEGEEEVGLDSFGFYLIRAGG